MKKADLIRITEQSKSLLHDVATEALRLHTPIESHHAKTGMDYVGLTIWNCGTQSLRKHNMHFPHNPLKMNS